MAVPVPKDAVACDKQRILIVDDEEDIRRLFRTILKYDLPDKSIDLACNGLDAVKSFREGHHAVILMDLRMPMMDGLQAFNAISDLCKNQNWRMPSVVFCTGFTPPDRIGAIVGEGRIHCLLHKPVTSAQITSVVRERLPQA